MDSGKMDAFCNGDGMPYFMSVSLPFCLSFSQTSVGFLEGEHFHLKKPLVLRVCFGFAGKHFLQLALKLQDIQIREKLTNKVPLKNTTFVTSTASFLSES